MNREQTKQKEQYEITFPGDPEHYFRYGQGADQARLYAQRAHNKKLGRIATAYAEPEKITRLK